jgi:hypothetical protein
MLRAVAVVNIPVEDHDSIDGFCLLERARGDRDVIEQTKPHRAIALCVVARRSNGRESAI